MVDRVLGSLIAIFVLSAAVSLWTDSSFGLVLGTMLMGWGIGWLILGIEVKR